jgi:hypothetical protein
MRERGCEIETDEAEIVSRFSSSIVHDDEGPTGCNGVEQGAMVGRSA